ncbi:MAG: hypothetical protein AAF184_11840 [Pseudomonadota bacterium]
MNTKSIIKHHSSDLALVIGNGINRYGTARTTNSWDELLVQLAKAHLPAPLRSVPPGIALTEFYDVLALKSASSITSSSLQKEFCKLMSAWRHYDHHGWIVEWAQRADRPILTTNFEETLSAAGDCSLHRSKEGGFTDYYPWESYYANGPLSNPADEFGIWHINGMQHYKRSIRLGLSHYMGSVERARSWIHKGNERRIFVGKNQSRWKGYRTWLNAVFNCSLLIFGLSLDETEVFLRWLLIERARYFKKFPDRRRDAWYVYSGDPLSKGKEFFLKGVGVTPVREMSYKAIYAQATWL